MDYANATNVEFIVDNNPTHMYVSDVRVYKFTQSVFQSRSAFQSNLK